MKTTLLLLWLACLSCLPALAQTDSTEQWSAPYRLRFSSFETTVVNGELDVPFTITALQDGLPGPDLTVSDNKSFLFYQAPAARGTLATSTLAAGSPLRS